MALDGHTLHSNAFDDVYDKKKATEVFLSSDDKSFFFSIDMNKCLNISFI